MGKNKLVWLKCTAPGLKNLQDAVNLVKDVPTYCGIEESTDIAFADLGFLIGTVHSSIVFDKMMLHCF